MRKSIYKPLEKELGYTFRRKYRLEQALIHPSFRYEVDTIDSDNQRLEFLGDAALGLIAADYLYDVFPDFNEGQLTKVRSQITNTRALASAAKSINLGDYLKLGKGEKQSGGNTRASNICDAFEAIIGAAYLDGGLKAVKKIFKKVLHPQVAKAAENQWLDNPKGALQELSQRKWRCSPKYRIVKEEGPAHSRKFTVEVSINTTVCGKGTGTNKRAAEVTAAYEAMHSDFILKEKHTPQQQDQPKKRKRGKRKGNSLSQRNSMKTDDQKPSAQ